MKQHIQKAIESLCSDICRDADEVANYKRAEAILVLVYSNMLVSGEITADSEGEVQEDE